MSVNTFSMFSSIFGFLVAAVSLFAFLVNMCRSRLPSKKIKELQSLLNETDSFFAKAMEDGLLIEPEFVRETKCELEMLRKTTGRLQARAYNATTLRQDYFEFLRGTSSAIGSTCQSLVKLRAQVATSSEKAHVTLAERNSILHSALPLNSLRSLPRPRSCPPVLSGWGSTKAGRDFTGGNPFSDPAQRDSDV